LGRASLLIRRAAPRALGSIAVAAFFVAGYFGVGRSLDPGPARELRCALDDRIPFVEASVWVYLAVFPASLLPLFVVRSPQLFRRTLLAYAAAIAVSLILFAAMPVTSSRLRVDRAELDPARASGRAVAALYRIDPPVNLFPSLHLSIAVLAALSAWRARRSYGLVAVLGVSLVAVSICTVKQHFLVDGLAGVALALGIGAALLRGYRPEPGVDPAFDWRGPAAHGALLVAVYAGLYAWFAAAG
jgi:hypothetical protein